MTRYFLNPWMLLALTGVLIPVIIELLFRRRRRQVELPTIRYLLKSRAEKKIRRQDRLLLLVRCMVPLVLAAAIARPMLAPEGAAVARSRHVVLVMDESVSMGQQVGVSVAFALAKKKASRLIRVLPKGTTLTLITMGPVPEVKLDRTEDLYAAAERMEAMHISHGVGTLADVLPLVRRAMATGERDEERELWVFSDFQKTTWLRKSADGSDPVRGLRELRAQGEVFVVDVGGERPFNLFLTALAPEEPLVVTDRTVRFRGTVEAKGTPPDGEPRATLTFLVDGDKKSMQEVTLKGGRADVTFAHRFATPGEHLVELGVEGDTHRLDNRRFYLASVPESLKVLVLDEASAGGRLSAEARYLSAAIAPRERPGLDRASIFSTKVAHPAEVIREDLASYAAVIVLSMERVPPDLVAKLEPYVREGGSAVLFLGGRVNPWEYNERLHREGAGVLPVRLESSQAAPGDGTLGIRVAAGGHRAFAYFGDRDALVDAGVTRFMSLAGKTDAEVIAYFTSGKPAVVEKTVGRGRVVAFCTAAGPPENLLAADADYPVMLQELLRYLAGTPDAAVNLDDGATFHQEVLISAQHLVLRKPDNTKVRLTPVKTGDDRLAVSFDGTDRMGEYRIEAQPGVLARTR
ncbi:MAG TPA: BatA domain-containing protein, partial [Planctomycetota bacterium]|nr:BatA domain-containing protein [Planctomycetota bacterium]